MKKKQFIKVDEFEFYDNLESDKTIILEHDRDKRDDADELERMLGMTSTF